MMTILSLGSAARAGDVDRFRLVVPDGTHALGQGSGLHYGRLGDREGLWLVCDRNGGPTAGRIYHFSGEQLQQAEPDDTLAAREEIIILPPQGSWQTFAGQHAAIGSAALADLRERLSQGDGRKFDLEAVTIAPSPGSPEESHLFVVAEEPFSLVLELALGERSHPTPARLVAVYRYFEKQDEQGNTFNDGLEGFTWSGSDDWFYWAEEGTRLDRPDAHPRLFFADPRLGRARLDRGVGHVDMTCSDRLTAAIRTHRDGTMQTLNALAMTKEGCLLAVDRNGGWILMIDPKHGRSEKWLNLYDFTIGEHECNETPDARGRTATQAATPEPDNRQRHNLREILADFPADRHMPYVSIEGIAVDDAGQLWLVDDPAMPEGFRDSCLIRIRGLSWPSCPPADEAAACSSRPTK